MCHFGFEFENFEVKEICEPGVMVSLYGLESLGFGDVLPRGALGMRSSNSSSCSMWVLPPPPVTVHIRGPIKGYI